MIIPNLWFDTEAEEAAAFYTSIFPNSRVTNVTHYTDAAPSKEGSVQTVEFELDGQPFLGLNGGPQYKFNEALSLEVPCEDQEEIDYYWEHLAGDGGEEGPCGWCKDRYGVSWQITPNEIGALLSDADPERAARVMKAVFEMKKLDIAALRAAADGA